MDKHFRFVLGKKANTSTLQVARDTHLAVKLYAQKENISMVEATYRLITAGLKVLWGEKSK